MHQAEGTASVRRPPQLQLKWFLFPLLLFLTLAIYYPVALHNLPVATYVDDRTSLAVLLRFHQGSANPKFFMYPTLYYYLTYLITAPFGFSRILFTGHLLNLGFVALTASLCYAFCVKHFRSSGAGIVAACCVIFSPTLIWSGAYLCTDVLLAAMTLLSLDWLMRYFESGSSRAWLIAMIAVGCAIATKYTAAILFIAYCISEVAQAYRLRSHGAGERKGTVPGEKVAPRFSTSTVCIWLFSVSLVCALVAVFFPVHTILNFVAAHRTNLETRSSQDYLVFLNRLRRLAAEVAVGTGILFLAARKSVTVYECIASRRPYYGLLIILGVFVITTPFCLLDPGKFIYDIGALLRANVVVAGTHQQWGNYWHWLFDTENKVAVVLGILGLCLMTYRTPSRSLPAGLYVALHVLTICTSHLGAARYLDPLLPLLYCGTGLMVSEMWKLRPPIKAPYWRAVVCLLGIVVLVQMGRRTLSTLRAASDHDAFYASYEEVLKDGLQTKTSGTVFYAGYAPSVELQLAGFKMQAVSWTGLAGTPLGGHLGCDDLMILNRLGAADHQISAAGDESVDTLLDDPRGQGQTVIRRRGCR